MPERIIEEAAKHHTHPSKIQTNTTSRPLCPRCGRRSKFIKNKMMQCKRCGHKFPRPLYTTREIEEKVAVIESNKDYNKMLSEIEDDSKKLPVGSNADFKNFKQVLENEQKDVEIDKEIGKALVEEDAEDKKKEDKESE